VLRPNIEEGGSSALCADHLYSVRLGSVVLFIGANACKRLQNNKEEEEEEVGRCSPTLG